MTTNQRATVSEREKEGAGLLTKQIEVVDTTLHESFPLLWVVVVVLLSTSIVA